MAHPHIALFHGSATAAFRYDGEPDDLGPRPADEIEADIQAAIDAGAEWVTLGHREATAHPELRRLLAFAQDLGARSKTTSNGWRLAEKDALARLRDDGLAQLTLVFWGATAEVHDRRVGRQGAFATAIEALDIGSRLNRLLITVRYVLMRDNADQVGDFVALIREPADRFELVRLSAITQDAAVLREQGVSRAAATTAIQAAWEAARVVHLKTSTIGFGSYPPLPNPREVPIQPVDATLLELLRNNVPVPSVTNGTWANPEGGDVTGLWYAVEGLSGLHELGLQLAAYGCPPLDLPPALGGRGLDHKPEEAEGVAEGRILPARKRDGVPLLLRNTFESIDTRPLPAWSGPGREVAVAVVAGSLTDNVLALSTLPALATSLQGLGADAVLHSVWRAPFNPYDPGHELPHQLTLAGSVDPARPGVHYPSSIVEALANTPARIAHARRQSGAFVTGLDLTGRELVVVGGFEDALRLLDNPTLPASARIVILDFHMLSGLGDWHQRWLTGGRAASSAWWPDERIVVHALYPRYVRAYWRAGVPMRQILWRPYPLHAGHFPLGPDPVGCRTVFSGGTHQRDFQTLASALRQLGPQAPAVVVHTTEAVQPPLVNQGEVRLLHFYEAIANSRYVVLPLEPDNRRPAGISVISMALAAGRPVIASATQATVDHLRHGHNAILVPPGQPAALARAMQRLQEDDNLLARLAAGARRSAHEVRVSTLAERLLDGAPAQTSWTMDEADRGPFFSWPA
jgi:hypothetical protein